MKKFRFKRCSLPVRRFLQFKLFPITITLIVFLIFSGNTIAQVDSIQTVPIKTYLITTAEGNEFFGTILYQDTKEVVIETKNLGKVSIPKYQIKELREVKSKDISAGGDYIPEQRFSSRYFITTNGLPLEKGDNYVLWNIYGPDMQFSISDHFGIGIMTSWIGVPIIGTAKYSFNLGKNTNMAVGALLGTGSWSYPEFGLIVPFTALTFGDRRNNINFSAGYGAVWSDEGSDGNMLLSVAGITTIGKKASLVFDSFIIPGTESINSFALFIPGIRIQTSKGKFFQYGFAAVYQKGSKVQAIPMIQWFKSF